MWIISKKRLKNSLFTSISKSNVLMMIGYIDHHVFVMVYQCKQCNRLNYPLVLSSNWRHEMCIISVDFAASEYIWIAKLLLFFFLPKHQYCMLSLKVWSTQQCSHPSSAALVGQLGKPLFHFRTMDRVTHCDRPNPVVVAWTPKCVIIDVNVAGLPKIAF